MLSLVWSSSGSHGLEKGYEGTQGKGRGALRERETSWKLTIDVVILPFIISSS